MLVHQRVGLINQQTQPGGHHKLYHPCANVRGPLSSADAEGRTDERGVVVKHVSFNQECVA